MPIINNPVNASTNGLQNFNSSSGVWTGRTITSSDGSITITNGSGTSGNPDLSVTGGGPYISLSPFIVGTDVHSGYSTIAAAITAAVAAGATNTAPQNVMIKPKADGSVYSENLTMQPGVNLVALGGSVTISGKLSYTQGGTVNIIGINLQNNGDFYLSVTGSAASRVYLQDCNLNAVNNTGIEFTTSSSSSFIIVKDCMWDLKTTGIAYYSQTSAGTLGIEHCYLANTGSSTTASTQSAGVVNLYYTHVDGILSNSGTGGTGMFNTTLNPGAVGLNATAMTFDGTGANESTHGYFSSGSASAVSIGVGATATLTFSNVISSNVNTITGAGTLRYAFIAFAGSSSGVNTATQTALATLI